MTTYPSFILCRVSAKDLWRNLKYSYGQRERSAGVSSPEYEEEIETTATITEHNENAKLMVKLPNLAQKGHSSKVKSILKKHKDAATEVIGDNGDTMLHLATALHIGAIVVNKYAAELLVKKMEKLLYIPDHESHVPLKFIAVLWKMRRFKDNYYCWLLPEIVMILLEPIKHIEKKRKEYEAAKILLYNLNKKHGFLSYLLLREVENIMEPAQLTEVNADNETPELVFTREHTNLVKEGEQWMKTTAESCSITAALIITIVFAAAITVPGGNNQDTGTMDAGTNRWVNLFANFSHCYSATPPRGRLVPINIFTHV
nr:ankyrin repeat-containing protein [Tanacetum cinerariifolium]